MLAASFKRTKIVATIGPATSSPQVLEELLLAGVNMFRMNFSHGTHEEHGAVLKTARQLSKKHNKPVAVLADIQGPKIRVGTLPTDGLPFVRGNIVRFEFGADYEATGIIPIQHDISKYLKKGERVFLRDGQVQIEVEKIEKRQITGKVLTPGLVYSNQGMNLPDTDLGGEILTPKDIADLEFAASIGADYIGYSFVQTAEDIEAMRVRLKKLKSDAHIIAKIETAAAIENLEKIVMATDAIMVARGDLAVETNPESVPAAQRLMIELGKKYRKPVIVATQMLESMIQSPQPTRAEVSDVATAVMEGSDAVMLSGETAMGLFPIETVKMMKRIILYTEHEELPKLAPAAVLPSRHERGNAISAAAVVLASQLPAKVIIAETSSGQTARNISSLRPSMPVIMVTDHERAYYQMAIVWGGKSYYAKNMEHATEEVVRQLKAASNIAAGDALVVASGHQPGLIGGTDQVQIKIVG
ncbi:MAG TPA: pyruvate kinase [Candidatus Saccharimonadia bacterium]|nr:pyruvate kinase [Candidatus Saccharimonadia bacterium]